MKHLSPSHSPHHTEKHYWSADHAKSIALVLSILITGLLLVAFVGIRAYIEPTI